jgi:chemotaxis protein methyltransferase CheR
MTPSHAILDSTDRLSDRHFAALVAAVEGHVGIKLPPAKRTMVEGRLRKRVRALGLSGLNAYGAYLFDQGGLQAEFVQVIDCVTTNKTDFFREPGHFEFLRHQVVPQVLRRGRVTPRLKIWSAACSTGAEAYTTAMVLQDMIDGGADFRYSILGTDVSTEVLAEARAGIYRQEFVAPVPAAMQQRYLMRSRDERSDAVRIVPELRRQVRFERLNLMDAAYPLDQDVDLIFCRNVLIYFDQQTQAAVVTRLASHLRPGGFLVLGHSESAAGGRIAGLEQVRPSIFQAERWAAQEAAA